MTPDRVGTGVAFPVAPRLPAARLGWSTGPDLLRQSVLLVLGTEPGERVMRPDFGCGLRQYLAEPDTAGTRARIGLEVERALRRWEPRITVLDVDVRSAAPGTVVVTVRYEQVRDGRTDVLALSVPLAGGAS